MVIWDEICGQNTSSQRCFTKIMWEFPTYLLLSFMCSLYIGKHRFQKCRYKNQHLLIQLRIIITLVLLLNSVITVIVVQLLAISKLFIIDYAMLFCECLCWLCLIVYLSTFRPGENQIFINLSFILSFIATTLNFIYMNEKNWGIEKYLEIFSIILKSLYILTSIIKIPEVQHSEFRTLSNTSNENDPLLESTSSLTYGMFQEVSDPHALGTAEHCGIFSKAFLIWVKPLINKGELSLIETSKDLFDLPEALLTSNISEKFQSTEKTNECRDLIDYSDIEIYNNNYTSLVQRFHRSFGMEYYLLGLLKLFSDLLSFSGPLLLNLLVSFLENDDNNGSYGYYYALAMLFATFLSALTSTQYNYLINRVSLKVRAALISTVYRKALNVSQTMLAKFSTGEIVNFMSTDTDRIVNFCQSFHQFWSLPVQVSITLYLLYQQIGYSFLVGVGFAVLIIPINQYIAKKIGKYSTFMMKEKDKRIKLMSEVLCGIKVIKMHAWEDAFAAKIDLIRKGEIKFLKKRKYLDAFCVYFWATTPVIISFLSFTMYALLGNILTASRIFTGIALFNMLIVPLNAFPWVLNGLVEAFVSLTRVQELLKLPDLDLRKYYSEPSDSKVKICDGVFNYIVPKTENADQQSRTSKDIFSLGPLTITIPQGKLVCVIGKVGSGKSTFLSAILAEIIQTSGNTYVPISDWSFGIGLVSQEPWIQQATIRDNILFGKTLNSLRYRNVLEACALFEDLKVLPFGDKTQVGDRGITLSGGQKARIALARAAYQDVDLYLLDDPIAAVDTHVADHILNHCILGLLKNKTRILCTHRLNVIEKADMVVVFDNGLIKRLGSPDLVPQLSFNAEIQEDTLSMDHDDSSIDNQLTVEIMSSDNLIAEEEKDTGALKLHVFKSYWNAIETPLVIVVLASCFCMQASRTLSDWWLSYWIAHSSNNTSYVNNTFPSFRDGAKAIDHGVKYYLIIYGSLTAANSVFTIIRAFSFAYSGVKAAKTLHNLLKSHIMEATMNFFCITPLGRILNRCSSDVYTVDDSLPFMLNIVLAQAFGLLGCIVITVYSLPFISVILVPLAFVYYSLQRHYRRTSRELKRISSVTLSPIYAHFSETLHGHSTIRALASVPRFERDNILKLDANQQALFSTLAASQWLNLRLQLIGVVFVTGIAFVALIQHQFDKVDPGLVGLALSYALSVTALLNGFVTAFTETEKEMVSVERIIQYIEDIPQEDSQTLRKVPFGWPTYGIITFKDVCLQYDKSGPYALEFINFETKRAEKLGIVGRTGSGKSSLIQALFRMVNINHGQISIDGADIARMSLKSLRSQMSVVPQDPFLFSGTIRENIDSQGSHSDAEVWQALQNCHMAAKVQEFGGLDAEVEEKGRNFSSGERQLLCLARTLLHKAKILCLDEATASIDHATDSLLQLTIRMAFRHTTIFIVAHRMETIMDCDRVMVMGHGRILELDKPSVLLADSTSEFYKLVYRIQ